MGQAVGTVAGLAVNGAVAPRDLPVDQIQARLRADGALI